MPVTAGVAAAALEVRASTGRALAESDAVLLRRWLELWAELEPELIDAVTEVLAGSKTGRVRPSRLISSKRIAQALTKARTEAETILKDYTDEVTLMLPEQVQAMLQVHEQVTAMQLPPSGVGYSFDDLNAGALDEIVKRSTEQITAAHLTLPAAVDEAMKAALMRGVAVGDNPNKVARDIVRRARGGFDGGINRARTIARTETLDAQREAATGWEKNNQQLLEGWVWVCTFDKRSCPSCIAQHGSVHPIDEPGPLDHQNGRCARVPKTKSWESLGFKDARDAEPVIPTGEEHFNALDEQGQNQLIGRTRAEMVRRGDIAFSELSELRTTTGWRDSYHMRTITELERIASAT